MPSGQATFLEQRNNIQVNRWDFLQMNESAGTYRKPAEARIVSENAMPLALRQCGIWFSDSDLVFDFNLNRLLAFGNFKAQSGGLRQVTLFR